MTDDLKPCPFCGSSAISVVEGASYRYRNAQCDNCGAMGPEIRITGNGISDEVSNSDRAMDAWNERI